MIGRIRRNSNGQEIKKKHLRVPAIVDAGQLCFCSLSPLETLSVSLNNVGLCFALFQKQSYNLFYLRN